jgi:predicted O-methyltransferase YrrM
LTSSNGHAGNPLLPGEADTLDLLVRASQARVVVQVEKTGADTGAAVALCKALEPVSGYWIGLVACPAAVAALTEGLAEAGVVGRARFLPANTADAMAALRGSIDVVFLARGCDYAAALRVLRPRLRPGSMIVAPNAPAQLDYWTAVTESKEFETTLAGPGGTLAVSLLRV